MQKYTVSEIKRLIDKYLELGGEYVEIEEGSLGYGVILLHSAPNRKSILIKEVFETCWNSLHTIRQYNKIPKKYHKYLSCQKY